jgi:benzoyl-CoA reductase/2-hydroxyglutaryl-CoA dehydratase subunit BcrC/BadD/HgdB
MKFEEFSQLIDKLSEEEEYETVDTILDEKINDIIKLESNEVKKYLELYASLAGDTESLDRFDRLFNKAVSLGKVKETELKKYEASSPSNRWL